MPRKPFYINRRTSREKTRFFSRARYDNHSLLHTHLLMKNVRRQQSIRILNYIILITTLTRLTEAKEKQTAIIFYYLKRTKPCPRENAQPLGRTTKLRKTFESRNVYDGDKKKTRAENRYRRSPRSLNSKRQTNDDNRL